MYEEKVRIGTIISGGASTGDLIGELLPLGFESFAISFWQTMGGVDLKKLARQATEAVAGSGAVLSCLSVFGNPLEKRPGDKLTRDAWKKAIDAAESFGVDLVTGFAGRLIDKPIDASMKRFKEVFGPLVKRAADRGVRIAFENCDMGGTWSRGDWNIAHNPTAWEMMLNEVPADNLGLQWEPCHQMVSLIDPIPQLRKWVDRVFSVHGKDATINWDVIREYGIHGPKPFAYHRTPGFGDSNWADIITILRQGGFSGSIDIEGFHDPVYGGELEMTGQVRGLNYLKDCRGGDHVPNPKSM